MYYLMTIIVIIKVCSGQTQIFHMAILHTKSKQRREYTSEQAGMLQHKQEIHVMPCRRLWAPGALQFNIFTLQRQNNDGHRLFTRVTRDKNVLHV